MIFTWDKDFDAAPADPKVLESHLEKLVKQRRSSWIGAGFSTAVCFFSIFATIFVAMRDPEHNPGVMVAVIATMLLGTIQQTSAALAAQADLRMLRACRKVLELAGKSKSDPP